MKIITFYLPQFHSIPENDEWWGKGFTEWVNVKGAKPLFEGHEQPRIPINENYYNLLDDSTIKWQIELAKEHGVYGFCFYHYWFNGHLLLEKPMENFLNNQQLNFPYCICWANENWTNAWVADGNVKTLIQQKYGDKDDWKNHFEYLLPFFMDKNYIKADGKPLFVIYRPEICECLNEMLDYWNQLAIEAGLKGICFAYQQLSYYLEKNKDDSRFSYYIEYQPGYARYDVQNCKKTFLSNSLLKTKTWIRSLAFKIDKTMNWNLSAKLTRQSLTTEDYDELCRAIINRKPTDDKAIPGMFVGWDNTPRRGARGRVCLNSTPEKFEYYLSKQIENAKNNYKKDMIFVFAWNEWAEGGYLEPDTRNEYDYLKAIKKAMDINNDKI
ncbi:glycoside hydrolase family 99-like domain-containing protein [Haloimpatiens sp. FM7315]|uniref:glycosyltransferase WbsX family protein n=1 Tax=Haloimpatiens sp. FM7315 TaxID=3298609 RepID=UPI00370A52EC